MATYDVVTIGGGLAGSSLARAMAAKGAKVLVIESTTAFRDRVRGEQMCSWGAGEARELGIYDLLVSTCANKIVWWDTRVGPALLAHRSLPDEAASGLPNLGFYHPEMQETLIQAAEESGAEVRRGVRVTGVQPGTPPRVTVEYGDGRAEIIDVSFVAACDGRNSPTRAWAGFEVNRDRDRMQISGLFLENMRVQADTAHHFVNPMCNAQGLLFPSGNGRVRAYFALWKKPDSPRYSGDRDIPQFIEQSVSIGIPPAAFEGASPAGPLATFDGADSWVAHPYTQGVALVGDAAAATDPNWGQGLSLTLRDVRELRDQLLSGADPDTAGHAYADAHDQYYTKLKTIEDTITDLFFEPGQDADARRGRVLPRLAEVVPEMALLQSGPDHVAIRTDFRSAVLGVS